MERGLVCFLCESLYRLRLFDRHSDPAARPTMDFGPRGVRNAKGAGGHLPALADSGPLRSFRMGIRRALGVSCLTREERRAWYETMSGGLGRRRRRLSGLYPIFQASWP